MSKKKMIHDFCMFVAVLTAFTALLFIPAKSFAHAPQKVMITYDPATRILNVTVSHDRFSEGHYIEKIEIKKNGSATVTQGYKSQPSESFSYMYKMDAVNGDVLEVKATCSRFGSKSEKLIVGKGMPAKDR